MNRHGSLDPGPTIDPLTATNHGSKEVMSDADDSVPVDRAGMRARRWRPTSPVVIDPGAAVAPNPRIVFYQGGTFEQAVAMLEAEAGRQAEPTV